MRTKAIQAYFAVAAETDDLLANGSKARPKAIATRLNQTSRIIPRCKRLQTQLYHYCSTQPPVETRVLHGAGAVTVTIGLSASRTKTRKSRILRQNHPRKTLAPQRRRRQDAHP